MVLQLMNPIVHHHNNHHNNHNNHHNNHKCKLSNHHLYHQSQKEDHFHLFHHINNVHISNI